MQHRSMYWGQVGKKRSASAMFTNQFSAVPFKRSAISKWFPLVKPVFQLPNMPIA